jgi:16S rRNA G1207 methylase RsmC
MLTETQNYSKLIQTVPCAGDIFLAGRMEDAMKQTFEELKRAVREAGLSFNVNKKIMVQSKRNKHIGNNLRIGET